MSSVYAAPGISPSLLSNRISFCFGLVGPSLTVDTACSSSLVALDIAVQSIHSGLCSEAAVAGVNLLLTPTVTKLLCRAGMMSPDARCKTFDTSADGYVRSEGVAAVVVTTLARAAALHQTALCVVAGTAVNHGGKAANLTAPNSQCQRQVIKKALEKSNISPVEVGYVEAHGTGTKLGDPIEVAALKAVFASGVKRSRNILIGSLKSNLGHTEGTAGIAGLLKSILVILKEKVPATVHLSSINPFIDVRNFDVSFPVELSPLHPEHPQSAQSAHKRLVTAVSSFGFGGTNAHVVLASPPSRSPVLRCGLGTPPTRPTESEVKCDKSVHQAEEFLERPVTWNHRHFPWSPSYHPFAGRVSLFDGSGKSTKTHPGLELNFTLRRDVYRFLNDHIIQNVPVVPGAAFIELLSSFGSRASPFLFMNQSRVTDELDTVEEDDCLVVTIKFLEIERPLWLPCHYASVSKDFRSRPRVGLRVTLSSDGATEIYSRPVRTTAADVEIKHAGKDIQEEEWNLHASGGISVSRDLQPSNDSKGLEEALQQCQNFETTDSATFYEESHKVGLLLGPRFRTIRVIYKGEICVNTSIDDQTISHQKVTVSEIQAVESEEFERGFRLQPAVLDGAIQTASVLLISKGGRPAIHVPVEARRIHLRRMSNSVVLSDPLKGVFVSRAKLLSRGDRSGVVSIEVWEKETGKLVAHFEELRLQQVHFAIPVELPREALWAEAWEQVSQAEALPKHEENNQNDDSVERAISQLPSPLNLPLKSLILVGADDEFTSSVSSCAKDQHVIPVTIEGLPNALATAESSCVLFCGAVCSTSSEKEVLKACVALVQTIERYVGSRKTASKDDPAQHDHTVIHLVFLTRGASAPTRLESDEGFLSAASHCGLKGFARSLRLEILNGLSGKIRPTDGVSVSWFDLDPQDSVGTQTMSLVETIRSLKTGSDVRLQGGRCSVSVLKKYRMNIHGPLETYLGDPIPIPSDDIISDERAKVISELTAMNSIRVRPLAKICSPADLPEGHVDVRVTAALLHSPGNSASEETAAAICRKLEEDTGTF